MCGAGHELAQIHHDRNEAFGPEGGLYEIQQVSFKIVLPYVLGYEVLLSKTKAE